MPFLLILALLIITGVVSWFISHSFLIAYAIGLILGAVLVFSGMRKLGRKAPHSIIAAELIYGLTGYRPINTPIPKETIRINRQYAASKDYAEITDVLKSMKFSATEAKQAAEYVMTTNSDHPLEDKVKMALQFLGDDQNVTKRLDKC